MSLLIWSLLLAGVGLTGLWLAGNHSVWGWVVGLVAQVLWVAYAVTTGQWGFLVSAAAYGFVYGRNALRWRNEHRRTR